MAIKFKNNASTTLAQDITDVSTSLVVAAGTGVLFPALGANDYFLITVVDNAGNNEIMKVTAINTDTLTVVRAQEGTTARAFAMNSLVELRLTAGAIQEILNVTYATPAEVSAGVLDMKAVSPATMSSANVASAVTATTASTCTGNAATATDMAAGHVLAGSTTAAAVLASIAPAVTTPAQFDNSTKLATTAFVRTAAGSLAGFSHITASTTLTSAHIGTVVNVNNTGVTVTLPNPQSHPAGSSLVVRAGYACTIAAPASNYIYAEDNTARTAYALGAGKTCTLLAAGNAWWAYGGSAIAVSASGTNTAFYATAGTYTFTVPAGVTKMSVYVQGGGGACANSTYGGTNGGTSSFSGNGVSMAATGGSTIQYSAGNPASWGTVAGGTGSGGNIFNGSGGKGTQARFEAVGANAYGIGGDPALFGRGCKFPGDVAILGGGGAHQTGSQTSWGGGAGGIAVSSIAVVPGQAYTVVVGAAGTSSYGNGAAGYVRIQY